MKKKEKKVKCCVEEIKDLIVKEINIAHSE